MVTELNSLEKKEFNGFGIRQRIDSLSVSDQWPHQYGNIRVFVGCRWLHNGHKWTPGEGSRNLHWLLHYFDNWSREWKYGRPKICLNVKLNNVFECAYFTERWFGECKSMSVCVTKGWDGNCFVPSSQLAVVVLCPTWGHMELWWWANLLYKARCFCWFWHHDIWHLLNERTTDN